MRAERRRFGAKLATVDTMKRAGASSIAAPETDARTIAEEAARRAGMGLGDWLDAVVAELAGQPRASGARREERARLRSIDKEQNALAANPSNILDSPIEPSSPANRSAPDSSFIQPRAKDHVPARPLVEALRGQIAALTSRLDRTPDQRPAPSDTEALRAGLASMTQSVVDLAPRNAAVALEGAVSELGQRLDAARRAGASDNLLTPVETLLREVLTTLRRHDPRAAVERLEGELRTLSKKVDSLLSGTISPETLERIQKQTEEIRDLLTAAARSPFPFQRLETQLGKLADRIELLTTSATPHTETHRLVESLSQARSQIERCVSASLLSAIERRLDRLAARVDEARAAETAKIDLRLSEARTDRIDGANTSIGRQEQDRPDGAELEAGRPDVPRAVNQQTSATDPATLVATLQDLTARPGEVVNRAAPSSALGPLEAGVSEIRSKLDCPPATAPDSTALATTLRELTNRLNETLRQEASFASIDPQLFGKLETTLGEVGAKLERQNRSADEIRALTGAIRELQARFDNESKRELDLDLMQHSLNQVSAKMDAVAGVEIALRSIELGIGALNQKFDLGDASRPDLRLVEQAADLLAERLGSADIAAGIERAIGELLQQLKAMRLNLQSSASNRSSDLDLAREILDLRAEQRNSDRRTSERLSEVQGTLEKLVGYIGRMESDATPAEDGVSRPLGAATDFATDANDDRLRDIPDRAPARPQPPAPKRLIDASNVLLEPGASAPKLMRDDNVEPAGALGRSGIDSHIAAARRAAQAALVESASKKPQRDSSLPSGADSPGSNLATERRRSFLVGRRRPVLLAIVVLATATTAAVLEWREGWPQALHRLQVSGAVRTADLGPRIKEDDGKAHSLGTIDYSPVGNVAPPAPRNSDHPRRPAPADLAAAMPASLAQSLRDEAAGGDPGAETELALRYIDGRTIAKDPATAARWLELAAVQGLPIAQYRLATLYEKGNGVARDTVLARSWYLKAANAGNARAMHNLGVLIAQDPHDGKPDYAEAAHWFRQAGELGVRDSQFNLGVLYGRGLGVPQDLGQSWLWLSLAARQGDADAAAKRDEVAAKLDANAQAAASKALAEFKTQTPSPEANEAPSPAGGWQSGTSERPPVPSAPPTARSLAAPGASG
jgi:localization factor PodJL